MSEVNINKIFERLAKVEVTLNHLTDEIIEIKQKVESNDNRKNDLIDKVIYCILSIIIGYGASKIFNMA